MTTVDQGSWCHAEGIYFHPASDAYWDPQADTWDHDHYDHYDYGTPCPGPHSPAVVRIEETTP